METIHGTVLFTHAAAGFTGLVSGTIAAFLRKRRGPHTSLGWLFTHSMYVVSLTGFPLAIMTSSSFLLAISIFTLHMVITGSKAFRPVVPKFKLWMSLFGFLGAFALLYIAGVSFFKGSWNGIIPSVFGCLLLSMAIRDWKTYRGKIRPNPLTLHINEMGGAMIAAYTAFLTTSGARFLDSLEMDLSQLTITLWLLPTVIGSIILTIVNIRVRKV